MTFEIKQDVKTADRQHWEVERQRLLSGAVCTQEGLTAKKKIKIKNNPISASRQPVYAAVLASVRLFSVGYIETLSSSKCQEQKQRTDNENPW